MTQVMWYDDESTEDAAALRAAASVLRARDLTTLAVRLDRMADRIGDRIAQTFGIGGRS